MSNRKFDAAIIEALQSIYDPEIPVNIYELGLIYSFKVNDENFADVEMTLTSPSCPVAESMPAEVEQAVKDIEGLSGAKVHLTFEPTWDKSMMSEEARLELGFL
tara:strand:+ start:475585 stop:475896 length:312 start_codon:yes stop_codon:yes gene_type:complete